MAIDISRPARLPVGNAASAATGVNERPRALMWINIGYSVDVEITDTNGNKSVETQFISLPVGLPVDTMEPVKTNSSNATFAAMQAAKNELLKSIIAAGQGMQPGEAQLVNLQVQLRRVNEESAVVSHPDTNPFIRSDFKLLG